MMSYVRYLAQGELPQDLREAKEVKRNSKQYLMIDGYLFRHGFTHPLLKCIALEEAHTVMMELHERTTRSHVGGRALSLKVIWVGYYWPTMKENCQEYTWRCYQCQRHDDWIDAPAEELHSIISP